MPGPAATAPGYSAGFVAPAAAGCCSRLPAVELRELIGDPALQPAAVLTLVVAQLLDLLLQSDPVAG